MFGMYRSMFEIRPNPPRHVPLFVILNEEVPPKSTIHLQKRTTPTRNKQQFMRMHRRQNKRY